MEGYFERVVETLTAAGYRWYETANFCLEPERAPAAGTCGRGTTSATGAVATTSGSVSAPCRRSPGARRNKPGLGAYVAALGGGEKPPAEVEPIDAATRGRERLMLGLRLDEPLAVADVADALDPEALVRLVARGLVERA